MLSQIQCLFFDMVKLVLLLFSSVFVHDELLRPRVCNAKLSPKLKTDPDVGHILKWLHAGLSV